LVADIDRFHMKRRIAPVFIFGLLGLFAAVPALAEPTQADLEKIAAAMAAQFSTLCPSARPDDVDAHDKCTTGLRNAAFIPFAPSGLLFGGDQPNLRLTKKQLTHFKPSIFQLMYLSLFTYTGRWSVDTDAREHVGVIHLTAYFRNALPPGEFPYPFWHSAEKWAAYEAANELKFYVNHDGQVFVVTRSSGGSEADRGPYAHVTTPAFAGNWQWTDASGQLQPRASLFSNRYSSANPNIAPLEKAYRDFATQARKGTCLSCHAPNNEANMDHLVLLQTPLHASGEIDDVLEMVRSGKMPQDDVGMRKEIAPELRAAILQTGETFRNALNAADHWEAQQHSADH
jgi:hypothetical protein